MIKHDSPFYPLVQYVADLETSVDRLVEQSSRDTRPDRLVDLAKFCMSLGIPYIFGGTYEKNKSFDCSSFVQTLYKHVGTTLPRVTRDQAKLGTEVTLDDLQAGDLLFFKTPNSSYNINHVGMAINNKEFIHTNNANENINIQNLDNSRYTPWIVTIKRIFK